MCFCTSYQYPVTCGGCMYLPFLHTYMSRVQRCTCMTVQVLHLHIHNQTPPHQTMSEVYKKLNLLRDGDI